MGQLSKHNFIPYQRQIVLHFIKSLVTVFYLDIKAQL